MPIICEEHGSSEDAYVCRHLLATPAQFWCSREVTADEPTPDAWCLDCDQYYREQGEWNEKNEGRIEIKLVCRTCYARLRRLDTGD